MKQTKIPGLVDYGDDDNAARRLSRPNVRDRRAASIQMPRRRKETKIPGLVDYGHDSVTANPNDSQGDGTWSGLWHDMVNPQAANLDRPQTWRDWVTKTYSPNASDVGRAALDDVTFGFADPTRAYLTGENVADLRARTADSQAALGPMGAVINAGTYALPGGVVAKGLGAVGKAGKVAGALGRYGAGAVEGGAASGTSSLGHQVGEHVDPLKIAEDTAKGAAFGVGGQIIGDAAAAAARNVSNYVRGSPGRKGRAMGLA